MGIASKLKREFGIDRPGERERLPGGASRVPYVREGTLRAMFADATTRELMVAEQRDFSVTHLIAQKGAPKARLRDRLVLPSDLLAEDPGARVFTVNEVQNPGELDAYTLYLVEERRA